ncbi:MAG: 30S ribosomal protein S4 [Candidatus Doudnabacteria bacterium]|nr:30S ribosomal protein S4 [Candidatus Doudnabacteria bacterium]
MRYTGPKAKKARRLGMAFTAKDQKILQRRSTPPGQHGQNRSRLSEYGTQLREKQKAKIAYGVLERQFEIYFSKALKQAGVTGHNLLKLLEYRLDNIVFRLGFAETRAQARQLVNHGFFEVNGKKVDIPSFNVKSGDVVSMREVKLKKAYAEKIREKLKSFKTLDWLELNPAKFSGKVLSSPDVENLGLEINTQLIVEHYSRT